MMSVKTTMRPPLEDDELMALLNIRNIPQPLKGSMVYREEDLEEFFIGYSRNKVGNSMSQKVTTKNVVLKNKGVNLPVKRNGKVTLPWELEESVLPEKVVIVLGVKEEYFVLDNKDITTYLLIGVFERDGLLHHVGGEGDMCG